MDIKDDPGVKAVCKKYRMDGSKKQNLRRFKNMSMRKKADWTRDYVGAVMVPSYLRYLSELPVEERQRLETMAKELVVIVPCGEHDTPKEEV